MSRKQQRQTEVTGVLEDPSQDTEQLAWTNASVVRVFPRHYIYVRDLTTNVTRLEVGPQTFVRKDNEQVIAQPLRMIIIPPRHYMEVTNPVARAPDGQVIVDSFGQVKLNYADTEIRFSGDGQPFPLYPGEVASHILPLTVVPAMSALRLKVLTDFEDGGVHRIAGDEYLFEGPGTYMPRKEVTVVCEEKARVVLANEALRMKASRNTVDRDGVERVAGEEWMVRKIGPYLPGVHETVVSKVKATVLTDTTAVHVRANKSFKDQLGVMRKNGEVYLITHRDMESFIPDVYEEIIEHVKIISLTDLQYCLVKDPVDPETGKNRLGHGMVVRGEASFFLKPGESLQDGKKGVKDNYILGEDEGLVLRAIAEHKDDGATVRKPGDYWMIKGPMEYVPSVQVEVVTKRTAIPLHENEGIYVRNTKTGTVRAVIGHTYMLGEHEELWKKSMSQMMRTLLNKNRDATADRGQYINRQKLAKTGLSDRQQRHETVQDDTIDDLDETRVVTFQVPNNAAVQIYDYKSKHSRVVFGPDLVMLQPNEEFTQLSLSGGKPKRPNMIRSVALLLGPDYSSDVITVETSDHACLQLTLAYHWHFEVDKEDPKEAAKLFCVNDFVGDMCHAIASRIRGAVSSVSFDNFHKNSAKIIRVAVFGVSESGTSPNQELRFTANNCTVTSIDIRSVEPVDQKTRDSLQQSVTLAIEITTQSQEAAAKREAERIDQEARGRLERQRIMDEAQAEKTRKELLELKALSAAVESTGQAKAEATSRAESMKIEAEAAVEAARLKAAAAKIEADAELDRLTLARNAELAYLADQFNLESRKANEMAEVETRKFREMVEAIGQDTLKSMASGPQDHQVKMLQSLGLTSTLITDGRTPINLLNTANGLLGGASVTNPNSTNVRE